MRSTNITSLRTLDMRFHWQIDFNVTVLNAADCGDNGEPVCTWQQVRDLGAAFLYMRAPSVAPCASLARFRCFGQFLKNHIPRNDYKETDWHLAYMLTCSCFWSEFL